MAKLKADDVRRTAGRVLAAPSPSNVKVVAVPVSAASTAAVARASAQQEVEARIRSAFEKARQDGLEQGQAAALNDYQQRLQAAEVDTERLRNELRDRDSLRQREFDALLQSLRGQQRALTEQAEALAVELALRALARLLPSRSDDGPVLAQACAHALRELGTAALRVRVPVCAGEWLRGQLQPGIELLIDASLRADQCFVETPRGDIEVGLATRLAHITEALLAALQEDAARGD